VPGGRCGNPHGAPRSLLTVDGLDLDVTGPDAIGGSPVCDLARYFKEMGHAARYTSQPGRLKCRGITGPARTSEQHKIL
jgi:tRNA (Thr-GGU) A37 N-methylase